MGSFVEINDTLRVSKQQGFPAELKIEEHINGSIDFGVVENRVFQFINKPKIRIYQQPPVRTFLVEDLGGKWLYWGLCHILTVNHNYETNETSGTYKIIKLNSPEEMRQMFDLTHFNKPEENYFKS